MRRVSLRKACQVVDAISEWTGKAVSFFLIPMCLLLVYEVIMRYGFNDPTAFSHETSVFLYGCTGMLAGAWVLCRDEHVRMDAVYGRLSPRIKAIIDLVTAPLFFFILAVLLWQGGDMAYFSVTMREHTQTPWGPPYYPLKIVIPLSAFLLLLAGMAKFIRDFFRVYKRELR